MAQSVGSSTETNRVAGGSPEAGPQREIPPINLNAPDRAAGRHRETRDSDIDSERMVLRVGQASAGRTATEGIEGYR
jgi:hypothetical protein